MTSSGQLHVDADIDFDLNFTFDLSQLNDPKFIIYDDSQITFNRLDIRNVDSNGNPAPIDITASFMIGGKRVLSLAVKQADILVNLVGTVSLVEDATDHRYSLTELGANPALWNVDLVGVVEANLPLYFPTVSTPFGGSTSDRNGDGYRDNVLHLDAEFRGNNDFDYKLVLPKFDLLGVALDVFALLNDPETLLEGLDGMFDGIKDGLNSQFASMALPMVGDKLKDAAKFIDNLRDSLLGVDSAHKNDAVTGAVTVSSYRDWSRPRRCGRKNKDTNPKNDVMVSDIVLDGIREALIRSWAKGRWTRTGSTTV